MNQRIIYLYEQYLNQTHNLSKETGFKKRNTVLDWSLWWRAVWVRQRLGCLYVCCLIYLKNGREFRPFKYTNEWVILASIGLTIKLYRTAWSCHVRQENYSQDCMIESMTTAAKRRRWDEKAICWNALMQFCYHSCTYSLINARMQAFHAGVLPSA